MTDNLFLLIFAIFSMAIAIPVLIKKRAVLISAVLGAVGSALIGVIAVVALLGGGVVFHWNSYAAYGGVSINIDALSAFFLLLTSIVGIAVSSYGGKYIELNERPRILAALGNLFLLLLFLIFSVDNSLEFLFVWETMALTTFMLINHNFADIKVNRAAWIYFVAAQIGAVFIVIAFAALYSCYQSFDFAVYKQAMIDSRTSSAIFVFAFIGFSIKAGIVPAHGWLPAAHSAAPGNISALLSAVMLKMALYGLIRFAFQFCVLQSYAVALVVVAFGLASALYGIYLSLREREMKRVLACSSIENMGLIFALIGISLLYKILGYNSLAVLAFAAALLHAFNHALVKGSLFLCASTVIKYTHQGNIEQLGGLMKLLPLIGWTFVISGIAICGVPLFNCFVSEWLMFKSIVLLNSFMPGPFGKAVAIISLLAFAATIAMVVVSFTRLLGITFFGTPRSEFPEFSAESKLLVAPQQFLLVVALVIGLVPGVVALVFVDIIGKMQIFDPTSCVALKDYFKLYGSDGIYAIILPLIVTLIVAGIVMRLLTAIGGRRTVTIDETWCCGNIPDKNMQYSAHGIAQPLLRLLSRDFGLSCQRRAEVVADRLKVWSEYVRRLQSGNLHQYVTYILAVTVILLIVVVFI